MNFTKRWKSFDRLSGRKKSNLEIIVSRKIPADFPIRTYKDHYVFGGSSVHEKKITPRCLIFQKELEKQKIMSNEDAFFSEVAVRFNYSRTDPLFITENPIIAIRYGVDGYNVAMPINLHQCEPARECVLVVAGSSNYMPELNAYEYAAKNPILVKQVVLIDL